MTRIVMLSPDEGQVDRRIVQEARTLARAGAEVLLYGVHPTFRADADGLGDVRLANGHLASPEDGPAGDGTCCALRAMERRIARAVPLWDVVSNYLFYTVRDISTRHVDVHARPVAALKPDVVFAHDLPVLALALAVRDRTGAQVVYDSHEMFAEQTESILSWAGRRYWRRLDRLLASQAQFVMAANPAIAGYLQELGELPERPTVVLNAVPRIAAPQPTGRLRDLYRIPNSMQIVLYQGGLLPGRNLDVLVEAWQRLRHSDIALVMLGTGPMLDHLAGRAQRLAMTRHVYLGRRVPQQDLLAVSADADLGLIPYAPTGRNNRFCTPNKLFEFVQTRTPILANRLPLVTQLIEAHGLGQTTDMDDPAAVATAIQSLMADTAALQRYRDNADKAADVLCWETEERKLLALYDRIQAASR